MGSGKPTEADPRALSKNALLARLEKAQWALRLQGLLMEHPVVDKFLEASSWEEARDDKGRVLGRVRFCKNYVLPPIPEARLEALETLFARHVSGLLPSTRREHAHELVGLVVGVLCTDAPAVGPEVGEVPAFVALGAAAEPAASDPEESGAGVGAAGRGAATPGETRGAWWMCRRRRR